MYQQIEARFEGQDVPCPPHWGGFTLEAERVELWVGVAGRLHHRAEFDYRFQASGEGSWGHKILCP